MEIHPQNAEFRNNSENFHPCIPGGAIALIFERCLCLHSFFVYASRKVLVSLCRLDRAFDA